MPLIGVGGTTCRRNSTLSSIVIGVELVLMFVKEEVQVYEEILIATGNEIAALSLVDVVGLLSKLISRARLFAPSGGLFTNPTSQ